MEIENLFFQAWKSHGILFTESFGKGSVFANFIGDEVIRGSRSNHTRFSNGEYLG